MSEQPAILVTGGAGFIGRRVVLRLAQLGLRVTVLDRREDIALDGLSNDVLFCSSDLRDRVVIKDLLCEHGTVIHLAAASSFLMYERRPVVETVNVVESFLNVLEAARETGSTVVYASTSAVYEGNVVPYDEGMQLDPPDQKALAKKSCEEFARLYAKRYGMTTIGVRPFSVYGEGEGAKGGYANVVSLFAWAMLAGMRPIVWGNGEQRRDFIHVDDVASVFVHCALHGTGGRPVINAGTGIETTFNEVISLINGELGQNLTPEYVKVGVDIYAQRLQASLALQKQLGVLPTIPLRAGIRRVLAYARALSTDEARRLASAQVEHSVLWSK